MTASGWFRQHLSLSRAIRVVLSCALVLQWALPLAYAAPGIPHLINFQGRLTNAANQPRNGTFTFKFAIYNAASNGTKLWPTSTENHTVTVINGIFSVILGGGGETIPAAIFGQDQAYVEVIVNDGGGDETLAPRQRLLAAPYAMNSDRLDSFAGAYYVSTGPASATQNIEGIKVFLGTVTVRTPTQPTDAVTKAYVDNITGGGIVIDLSASTQTKTGGMNAAGYIGAGTANPSAQLHAYRGAIGTPRTPMLLISTGTTKIFEVNGASAVVNVPLGFSDGTLQYTAYPGSNGFIDTTASTQAKTGGAALYGKLGIGTLNPAAQAEIIATGNSFPDSWNDNLKLTGISPALWMKDSQANNGYMMGTDNGQLRFGRESGNVHQEYVLTLDGAGSMGVGTTAPASKLHVMNAAAASGPQMIVSTGTSKIFEVNGSSVVVRVPFYFADGNAQTAAITATSADTFTNKTIGSTGLTFSGAATDVTTGANEDFVIVPNGSGRFGIGTAAPDTQLHIYEAAATGGPLMVVSTGTTRLFEVNGASVVIRVPLSVSSGGGAPASYITAVSVDTLTNKTWNGSLIDVQYGGTGAGSLTGIIRGNGTGAFTTVTTPTGNLVGESDTQTLTNKSVGSTGLTFSGATTDMTTGSNEHLAIVPNGSGRVGIGTTVPDTSLQIFESAGTAGPLMAVSTGTTRIFEVNGASVTLRVPFVFSNGSVTLDNSVSTQTKTGGLNAFGRVGIGTDVPNTPVHVYRTSGFVGPLLVVSTGSARHFEVNSSSIVINLPLRFPDGSTQGTAYTGAGFITASSADTLTNKTIGSTGLTFSGATTDIATVSNEHFAIMPNGSGKVGIGTTSPSSLFDILNGSITVRGTNLGLQVGNNFVVQSGGNVGVGTVNPSSNLYVVGTSSVTGKLVGLDLTNQVYAVYAP